MDDPTPDRYDPIRIEEQWQAHWDAQGTNRFTRKELEEAGDPFYNLMMFPYPSAEGLHVGNIYAFTGADVHGRFHRLQGRDVFEPIGFDAFGIHSENFALKVGTHPMDLIPANVANFTRQLRRIGGMFDWDRTVDTTAPEYYRWTQWLFLQLFKGGLAEQKEAPVNWCPSCMTVLANEQVVAGLCERCDTAVEQRRIAQWFFRITRYAQRLLDNLETLDWSTTTRKAQENWIGRSEGALLRFPVLGVEATDELIRSVTESGEVEEGARERGLLLEVFTTRPDTVFGATYMVLAPEHPLVDAITTAEQRDEVAAYRERVARMDLVARKKVEKEKTGVFTGGFCRNPATGEEVPVWVADYVLMEYGTGAIMAVPGHDDRDFEFARTFDLPIPRVVAGAGHDADTPLEEAYTGPGTLVNSGEFDDLGVEEGKEAVTRWLEERGLAQHRVNYRLHDWCISRQRYWGPPIPIIHCDRCGAVPVPEEDLPVILPRVEDFKPDDSGVSPLARVSEWYETECPECGSAHGGRPTSPIAAGDRRLRHLPGLVLVLPPLPVHRPGRPCLRPWGDPAMAPGERLHRGERARRPPPALFPLRDHGPPRSGPPGLRGTLHPFPGPRTHRPGGGQNVQVPGQCDRTRPHHRGVRSRHLPSTSCSWDPSRRAGITGMPESRGLSASSSASGRRWCRWKR